MYSETLRKFSTVFGAVLLMLPTGVQWYWGNLATYVLSYFHSRDPSIKGTESSWVISIFLTIRTISQIASGCMVRYLGMRMTTVIGIVTFNIGLCVSYFALQHSMTFLNFALGGLCGLGVGIIYGPSLQYPVPWAGCHLGLFISIVQSSYNIGAIILNQVMTLYVNPINRLPDIDFRDTVFFSQMDILTRVPFTFVILTTFSMTVQIIGVCIVREKKTEKTQEHNISTKRLSDAVKVTAEMHSLRCENSDAISQSPVLELMRVLRTGSFYILWFITLFGDLPYIIATNYYKIFGQIFIRDDHFLSTLGTVSTFAVVVAKTVVGHLFDIFPFKTIMIINYSLMAVATFFTYVAPNISKWMYFLDILLQSCTSSVPLIMGTVVVVKLYGDRNVALNSGLLYSADAVMDLLAPPVIELILNGNGWLTLFYSVAGFSLICFLLIPLLLPEI